MRSLEEELIAKHPTGNSKYTTAMKSDIVCAQLQYRRDCLGRTLRPGALASSLTGQSRLDALLDSFEKVLADESRFPSLLSPPQIREVYTSHTFANEVRSSLDGDRNEATRAMTRHFLATYEGGVFLGWRATADYALGRPRNPQSLVGQRVAENFGGKLFAGTIVSFNKWWRVEYDDGDAADLNYRQLANLATPPDFDPLEYDPSADVAIELLRSGGAAKSAFAIDKGGVPPTFNLECQTWTFISVFLGQDTKIPIQGAYCPEDDFCYGMRDMGLTELRSRYKCVEVSSMENIRSWIEASEKAQAEERLQ